MIPLKHYERTYGYKAPEVGRHECGWVTDRCFMIKTSARKCYKRLKLAEKQMTLEQFERVMEKHFSGPSFSMNHLGEEQIADKGKIVPCVRLGNENFSVLIARAYFEYFDELGMHFVTNGRRDHFAPLGIVSEDGCVGLVMPIRE